MDRTTTLNRLLTCPDRSHDPRSLLIPYIYLHFVDQRFTSRHLMLYQHRHSRPVFTVVNTNTNAVCIPFNSHKKNPIMKSSRVAGVIWTPASSMPQTGFLLSWHRKEKTIRVSRYLKSLWCSKVCSSLYSMRCAEMKRKSLPSPEERMPHPHNDRKNKAWRGRLRLIAVCAAAVVSSEGFLWLIKSYI